jgi:hypothetical protein
LLRVAFSPRITLSARGGLAWASAALDARDPKGYQWPRWGASLVTGDAQARDLDEGFIANVGREGVLLHLREGVEPPEALTRLAEWVRRVEALLLRCAS